MVLLPAVLMLAGCGTGGSSSSVEIGENGNWIIDGVDSGVAATGKGIESVEKTGSEGKVDTYTITFTDGTTTTFTITNGEEPLNFDASGNTLTRSSLEDLQGDISLNGSFNIYKGTTPEAVDESQEEYLIDVTFNDEAWDYSLTDSLYAETKYTVYKIGDEAIVTDVDVTNSLVYLQMVDANYNQLTWDSFVNPLKDLTYYQFKEVEDEAGTYELRLELEGTYTFATEVLLPTLANVSFPDLESVKFKLEGGRVKSIDFESSVQESVTPLGTSYYRYSAVFDVTGTGDSAYQIPDPSVKPTLPEHEHLAAALEEIATKPIAVTETTSIRFDPSTPWEEAEMSNVVKGYFTDTFGFLYNETYQEGNGAIVEDGEGYNFTYDGTTAIRDYYPTKDEHGNSITDVTSVRGDLDYVAPEIFTPIDDKHFELTGSYAGEAALYLSVSMNSYAYETSKVTIELDDNYKIKSIVATDDYMVRCEETFDQIGGTIELPFALEDMEVGEDTFAEYFAHTFKFTDDVGVEHSVVVTSKDNITVDGVAATDIAFDPSDLSLSFNCGDDSYTINYFSSAEYYNLIVEHSDGTSDYYNDYWDGTLTIE